VADVVGTSTYPSILNTTVNVMRPQRPILTSPLTKANRPRMFTTLIQTCAMCVFARLLSKNITGAIGVIFRALLTNPPTKPRAIAH
jgi:hypothetical protein